MKKFLEGLLREKAPGPHISLSVFHLIKALELISKEGPIGRGKLSKELGTGEGATRTLIDRLKDAKLIIVSKPGCSVTKKGEKIWNENQSVFPQKVKLDKNELTLFACNIAVLVKGRGNAVKSGMEQRDAAIMVGAKGATTLVFKNKKLFLPAMSENVAQDFPVAFNQIVERLKLDENDVVVIGSAETFETAEYGALAAAWTLIENDCG